MNTSTIKIGSEEGVLNLEERGREHPFSSGSIGYYGSGKLSFNDKKYQVSVTLVEIGSKPQPK